MVARTGDGETTIYFAERGRLVVDRDKRAVDLVLTDGYIYKTGKPGDTDTHSLPRRMVLGLNPESSVPEDQPSAGTQREDHRPAAGRCRRQGAKGMSAHPEVIAIQQKFSFPVACLVFALIGLALGLTVAREGKLASFVIGVSSSSPTTSSCSCRSR